MSDFSDYMENAIANLFRGTAYTPPTNIYVALFSTMPSEGGIGGTEATTTIRAAGRPTATFGAPSGGTITNSADVDFGNAAGATTVVGFGLYDAGSAGNLLALKTFGTSQTVAQNAGVKFATGALTLSVQ